jgi:8-amino-7-oxononanoate synthase
MLDFTSALYLGLRHPSDMLRPWASLTSGRPAALGADVEQRQLARALAQLQGTEAALLGPSTLHLFWDLFDLLARPGYTVHVDAGAYPISRWGVERARLRGVPVRRFRHHDARGLRRQVLRGRARGLRPIVVADGFCPGCGEPAPIAAYLNEVRAYDGILVLDDTQALGILGTVSDRECAYGRGGGGSLRHSGQSDQNNEGVVMVSSLAKGFGVPVAVLSGSAELVERFAARSATRVHSSPPSAAVVHAAERALEINRSRGDALREQLAQRVRRLRTGLRRHGLSGVFGLFPVQNLTLDPLRGTSTQPWRGAAAHGNRNEATPDHVAGALHARLLRAGLRTVLHAPRAGARACISLLVTAAHSLHEIDRAVELIGTTLEGTLGSTQAGRSGTEGHHARRDYGFAL